MELAGIHNVSLLPGPGERRRGQEALAALLLQLAQTVGAAVCRAVGKFCTTLINSPPAVFVEVHQNRGVV